MPEPLTVPRINWYLSQNGKTVGPFSTEQVVSHLLARKIPSESLACPDGGDAWRPLDQWPQFHEVAVQVFPKTLRLPPVSPPTPSRTPVEWMFLIYGLVLNPLLLALGTIFLIGYCMAVDNQSPFGRAEISAYAALWIVRNLPRAWMIASGVKLLQRQLGWQTTMAKGMWGFFFASAAYFPVIFAIMELASALQAQNSSTVSTASSASGVVSSIALFSIPELFAVVGGLVWLRFTRVPSSFRLKGVIDGK